MKFGAKPKLSADQLSALRREFAVPANDRTELSRRYGVSRSTLYRLCAGGIKEHQTLAGQPSYTECV